MRALLTVGVVAIAILLFASCVGTFFPDTPETLPTETPSPQDTTRIGTAFMTERVVVPAPSEIQGQEDTFIAVLADRPELGTWFSDQRLIRWGYGLCGQLERGLPDEIIVAGISDPLLREHGWFALGVVDNTLCHVPPTHRGRGGR